MSADYDLSKQLAERPILNQVQNYTREPLYIHHEAFEDKLAILVCQIKIWQPNGNDWVTVPSADNCLTIRECESIEYTASTKELVNKAVVKFSRGTVINLSSTRNAKVTVGNDSDSTVKSTTLEEGTNNGDLMVPGTGQSDSDGTSTTSMAVRYDEKGLIDFNRTKTETALLSPNDVATGNRIEIRCGYAYSETEYKEMNATDSHSDLAVVFTGFITAVSVNTPLELECTNLAYILTTKSVPNIAASSSILVKDFLDDDGKYHLLKDTGIEVAEECKGSTISISGGAISNNLTIADVLTEWNKGGVLCMMKGSTNCLKIGREFFAGKIKSDDDLPNSDPNYITYNGGDKTVTLIQFDWDMANDKLSFVRNDKKYLAIEAHGRTADDQIFKLTIRKLPNNESEGWMVESGQFQVVNRQEVKDRKKEKIKNGVHLTKQVKSTLTDRADLSKYNVVPYFSLKKGITEDELIEEAKQVYANYNQNGISGSVTIFGDLTINPADIVGFIDPLHPEKNGYYYVESVSTSFGLDGYRRELKVPFRIASFSKNPEIIR